MLSAHFVLIFFLREPPSELYGPLGRLWGFDTVAYMPLWYILAFYLVPFALCSTDLQRRVTLWVSAFRVSRPFEFIRCHKAFALASVAFLFSLMFYFVRTHYSTIGEEHDQITRSMGRDFGTTKYLSEVFLYRFHKFVNAFLPVVLKNSLRLYDACAGFLFIWLALLISDEIGGALLKKGVIALLTIGSGFILVFFGGYDPNVLGLVVVAGYVYAGLVCIKEKLHVVVPVLMVCICELTDLRLLALFPSALVLIYYRHIKARAGFSPPTLEMLTVPVLILLPLIYPIVLFNGWASIIPLLVPQKQFNLMTLLEFRQSWESLNAIVLLSGGVVFFLMGLMYQTLRGRVKLDPVAWFLGAIILFVFAVTFAADSPRGSWDWSSYSFFSLACTLVVAHCLTNLTSIGSPESISMSRGVLPLAVFNALAVIPWIVVNTSALSFQKLENMIIGDPAPYYYTTSRPYFELTLFCHQNNFTQMAYVYAIAAEAMYPDDPRSYYNTAVLLKEDNRGEEAETILQNLITNFPQYPPPYRALIGSYENSGRMTEAIWIVDKIYSQFAKTPSPFLEALGNAQMRRYLEYLEDVERNHRNNPAKADSILSWIKYFDKTEER